MQYTFLTRLNGGCKRGMRVAVAPEAGERLDSEQAQEMINLAALDSPCNPFLVGGKLFRDDYCFQEGVEGTISDFNLRSCA